jgi:hypothetical protein
MNNAAGERSEPAASEGGAVGFNASLGSKETLRLLVRIE